MEYSFESGKVYLANVGMSCFWIENGNLQGDALTIAIKFQATELDYCNFVVDFGSLKSLKGWLEDTFDHKMLIYSQNQSQMTWATQMEQRHIVAPIVMEEEPSLQSFAKLVFECVEIWLKDNGYAPRVSVSSVSTKTRTDETSSYSG